MELGLDGGDFGSQLEWAKEHLGQELSVSDVFVEGAFVDAIGVTKGYGWQGVIKRFGGKLQSHKNSKKRRQHGNMGDFGTGYVRKTIRQGGQTGYHQRTEYNKRILSIASAEDKSITPAGGFLHYGEVNSQYLLIKGSLPGPAKRLVTFRDATRGSLKVDAPFEITYVSTASKQGV
jgi:large subunit ribosomal protein L3